MLKHSLLTGSIIFMALFIGQPMYGTFIGEPVIDIASS